MTTEKPPRAARQGDRARWTARVLEMSIIAGAALLAVVAITLAASHAAS